MKNILKNLLLLFSSIIFCFIILEIALKYYNPFPMRIRGEKIELPVYHKYVINNNKTDKLDNPIIYTRNSLGFRGEEPPSDLNEYLSIITIGGSTTECLYLSDDKTWSYLLGEKLKEEFNPLWLNNAGLDGHSTYGHIILLNDYVVDLRPKVIIFLIGINDVEQTNHPIFPKDDDIKNILAQKSDLVAFLLNIFRIIKAQTKNLGHNIIDLKEEETINLSEEEIQKELLKYKNECLGSYEKRLSIIIDICKRHQIEPIFVTQPMLLGDTIDESSGIYLGNIKSGRRNGILYWKMLELYNNTTIKMAKENNILVIDLANILPKDSKYFYDFMHFSNKGAEEVARILFVELKEHLKRYNR